MRRSRVALWSAGALLLVLACAVAWLAVQEARTSRWQSEWLARIGSEARYELGAGPSMSIRFPEAGPFDRRLGYTRLPEMITRLQDNGFRVTEQARMSQRMVDLIDRGLYPPYHEKTQAGLELFSCRGEPMYTSRHPGRLFANYHAVPPVLTDMLVYIENRKLFDEPATRNPAVEWQRFARAAFDQAVQEIFPSHDAAGGSTLATQIEKYRHTEGGLTSTPRDKLVQMASASLRSYLDGPDTTGRRREVVVDYLNSVPLSARRGYGEVIGFGDALWVWYGRDFDEVTRLLRDARSWHTSASGEAAVRAQALALKQSLSLLVSQRRPSHYLSAPGIEDLRKLTDVHLKLLAEAGVISRPVRDAALPLPLELRTAAVHESAPSFQDAKAAHAVRNRLMQLTGVGSNYELDRLDLSARSTFDAVVQKAASETLRSLATREGARAAELVGPSLLRETDDPQRISYSFTLFESNGSRNLLRVQTDNLDQPFDLNEGARLDLGSTSKLRTLITYLQLVDHLHYRWAGLTGPQLAGLRIAEGDAIARWARDYLAGTRDRSLSPMLEAALDRKYSANPGERFFTGGGVHTFNNFESRDNGRVITMREALTRSVNLPFIRLMRDIVRHIIATDPSIDTAILHDAEDPRRRAYMARFADDEGSEYMSRYYRKYHGLEPRQAEAKLVAESRRARVPLASVFFMLEPQGSVDELRQFLQRWLPAAAGQAGKLHAEQGPGRWNLQDRGYLASVHPLELWVAGYLRRHPQASRSETLETGAQARQEAYAWLFKTQNKSKQDRRIREQFEQQAFGVIQRMWARLGYPFQELTPSYAASLGASGDRPAALAELAGIVANGGLRLPVTRIRSLAFATGTPYETRMQRDPGVPERVLSPQVADSILKAMRGVVEEGTGRRLKDAVMGPDGMPVLIGGKTGTGDHRFDRYDARGQLISSRVVNRTATLVFVIGERYFGTIMAYAHEPHAADYRFTSALPTQLMKALVPVLQPMMQAPGCGGADAILDPSAMGNAGAAPVAERRVMAR